MGGPFPCTAATRKVLMLHLLRPAATARSPPATILPAPLRHHAPTAPAATVMVGRAYPTPAGALVPTMPSGGGCRGCFHCRCGMWVAAAAAADCSAAAARTWCRGGRWLSRRRQRRRRGRQRRSGGRHDDPGRGCGGRGGVTAAGMRSIFFLGNALQRLFPPTRRRSWPRCCCCTRSGSDGLIVRCKLLRPILGARAGVSRHSDDRVLRLDGQLPPGKPPVVCHGRPLSLFPMREVVDLRATPCVHTELVTNHRQPMSSSYLSRRTPLCDKAPPPRAL